MMAAILDTDFRLPMEADSSRKWQGSGGGSSAHRSLGGSQASLGAPVPTMASLFSTQVSMQSTGGFVGCLRPSSSAWGGKRLGGRWQRGERAEGEGFLVS